MGYEGCGGPDKVHMRQHKDHSRHCKPSAETHVEHVRPHEWRQCWSRAQRRHEQIEDVEHVLSVITPILTPFPGNASL